MLLDEYINRLQRLLDEEGNHPVMKYCSKALVKATTPDIEHLYLLKPRQSTQRTWATYDEPERKGIKIFVL